MFSLFIITLQAAKTVLFHIFTATCPQTEVYLHRVQVPVSSCLCPLGKPLVWLLHIQRTVQNQGQGQQANGHDLLAYSSIKVGWP